MANVRKGLIRILWILSIGASFAAWIILFSVADLTPAKKINKAGVLFVNQLDRHYFADARGLTVSEFELTWSARDNNRMEKMMAKIENSIKSDSVERWPFVWEYIPENAKRLDPDTWLIHTRWQERMRKALLINKKEIKNTFPDIDLNSFMQRYDIGSDTLQFNVRKYLQPESYFKIKYRRPIGRMVLLFLLGFVPFISIWLLWFLVNWVISGFKG